MKKIKKFVEIVHRQLTKHDWDGVYAIVADEGFGKSNLGLHITEEWINKSRKCTEKDIKHINLDLKEWLQDLRDLKKFGITCYDEAGDIASRRSMSDVNLAVMKTYQVIRGLNLMSLLVLPSLWDLDGFFVKRRLRGMFYVYKRGKVAFWNREKMREMVAINASRPVKDYFCVSPLWVDNFPIYNGILKKKYLEKKNTKMEEIRKAIYDDLIAKKEHKENPFKLRNELIVKMNELLGIQKTINITGLKEQTVRKLIKETKRAYNPGEDLKPWVDDIQA